MGEGDAHLEAELQDPSWAYALFGSSLPGGAGGGGGGGGGSGDGTRVRSGRPLHAWLLWRGAVHAPSL